MRLFKRKPSKPTILTVEIDGKAYDYPKHLPIPRIDERISVGKSDIATVKDVLYQVSETHEKHFSMITIKTEIDLNENAKCEKCGGRTALIRGNFIYEPDAEPYQSGVEEESIVDEGEIGVAAFKCDVCGRLQGFFIG